MYNDFKKKCISWVGYWLVDVWHCASPPAETKNVMDKSNVLGDVKIISEEWKNIIALRLFLR